MPPATTRRETAGASPRLRLLRAPRLPYSRELVVPEREDRLVVTSAPALRTPPDPGAPGCAAPEAPHRTETRPRADADPGQQREIDSLCRGFAVALVETLHGIRPIGQMNRWLNADVYGAIRRRAELGLRRRIRMPATVPPGAFHAGTVVSCVPAQGVVEAAVVVSGPDRVRAIALRLELVRTRWIIAKLTVG